MWRAMPVGSCREYWTGKTYGQSGWRKMRRSRSRNIPGHCRRPRQGPGASSMDLGRDQVPSDLFKLYTRQAHSRRILPCFRGLDRFVSAWDSLAHRRLIYSRPLGSGCAFGPTTSISTSTLTTEDIWRWQTLAACIGSYVRACWELRVGIKHTPSWAMPSLSFAAT